MNAIDLLGSEAQKQCWLPAMARVESLGGFALAEPEHGSDSVALESSARRDGDAWVLNGAKRWIGNGSVGDVVVVWARDVDDGQVKGFLVEKGTPGFSAETPVPATALTPRPAPRGAGQGSGARPRRRSRSRASARRPRPCPRARGRRRR